MKNLTHVLIALQRYEAGGAERQALYLAKGLKEMGHTVTVIAFGNEGGLAWDRFQEAGIKVLATGFNERLILPGSSGLKTYLLKWKYTFRLIRMVRKLRVQIILPFTYQPNVIYGSHWKRMNAKACYWNQRDEGRLFLGRDWEIKALENCTRINSNSMEGKFFLTKFTNHAISIIHNGVEFHQKNEKQEKDIEKLRVVMVANLHRYKDHLTLLKAWTMVVKQCGTKVLLILAGKDGDTAILLKEYVKVNDLESSVVFAGQVDDVPSLLQTCQIGVFSSVKEGVPNGILECMAVGLPMVATNIEGAREALGNDYPYLAKPLDESQMAEKLLLLMGSATLRETIGEKLKEKVMGDFSMKKMLEQYSILIHGN